MAVLELGSPSDAAVTWVGLALLARSLNLSLRKLHKVSSSCPWFLSLLPLSQAREIRLYALFSY